MALQIPIDDIVRKNIPPAIAISMSTGGLANLEEWPLCYPTRGRPLDVKRRFVGEEQTQDYVSLRL